MSYLQNVFWFLTSTGEEEGVATHDPLREEVLEQQTRIGAKHILLCDSQGIDAYKKDRL